MRIGLSMKSSYPVADPREGALQMLDRARAAQTAGLHSLFLGDHHAVPIPYYQNAPMLGRLLAEWHGPVCGALFLLPLWHPVVLAEQVGTLAALAPGRFVLQCALGADDAQYPALGISARERRSRFEECLGLLRRLLAGEEVQQQGQHWQLAGARATPHPAEPVEVWIGASAPAAVDRAARLGDGWLASPHLTPEMAAAALASYRERCRDHGRPVGTCAIRRDVYVGESTAEAERTGGTVVARGHRGFAPEACVVGDVERVAAHFRELEELGYTDIIVRNLVQDAGAAVACIERLATVAALARQGREVPRGHAAP